VTGQDDITNPRAIENRWRVPGFDPGRDIRLVFAPGGQLAGWIVVWALAVPPVHPWIEGRVDPDFEGMGVGSWLLAWAEQRASQELRDLPPDVRFAPWTSMLRDAEKACLLLESRGFRRIRSSYAMHIEMQAPPSGPVWPEGITVRTYDPERDLEAVYRADNESFRDHFGHVEEPYEQGLERFKQIYTGYEGFDPSLWFLAMDGDEVAGISLCLPGSYEDPECGWVDTLAVRRPWRKRGVATALLCASMHAFKAEGLQHAVLGVDTENLSGALRVYERVGFKPIKRYIQFEKRFEA
jgi:GNAT superfamily N-acetyltransferase